MPGRPRSTFDLAVVGTNAAFMWIYGGWLWFAFGMYFALRFTYDWTHGR